MKVSEVMTRNVVCCRETDSACVAALIMWDNDCGVVPVVNADLKVVGMITDRDVCMAAYTQGGPLDRITVASAMARAPVSVAPHDDVAEAHRLMRLHQVHRLPVTDSEGGLVGLVSLCDLVRVANGDEALLAEVGRTLGAISRPRLETQAGSGFESVKFETRSGFSGSTQIDQASESTIGAEESRRSPSLTSSAAVEKHVTVVGMEEPAASVAETEAVQSEKQEVAAQQGQEPPGTRRTPRKRSPRRRQ